VTTITEQALLWAYCIKSNGQAQELSRDQLPYQCAENEYLWVHLQSDMPDAMTMLKQLAVDEDVAAGLTAMETRPRAFAINGGALVFLRGINVNPGAEPEDMVSLRLWLNGNTIISARRHERKLLSVQDAREQVIKGAAPDSPAELLIAIVSKIADRISDILDDLDEGLISFEIAQSFNKQDRQALASLRRRSASMRRYLAPQRDALDSLFRLPGALKEDQAYDLREQADRMTRYVEDLDLARERTIVLQDELRNHIADQQGVRMYVLSMVTAIFLPLSFLTGVFGMNVAGLPGTDTPNAFSNLMIGMLVLAVFMLIAMVWKKWL
jgi:zinc transporter